MQWLNVQTQDQSIALTSQIGIQWELYQIITNQY